MTMPHTDFDARLGALVDGELDADAARALRAHVETCDACRATLADLERLRDAARGLGPVPPPAHVWMHIAGRIRLDGGAAAGPPPPRRASVVPWLGLAAALVLITIGIYFVTGSGRAPVAPVQTTATGNAPATDAVEAIVGELNTAAKHYENAMAELERLARDDSGAIDPQIATMLRTQLDLADRAIAESRSAMAADPGSAAAQDSLFEAFRRKVSVLQATVSLMNEMRRGDPEGASEAARQINKKG
jgi:hypothetical protein